ncbi:MAG TPA: glycosyltransferase family 2 protein [Myxococcota bacterium]|nr:glycosyltransferase family 2 protein [Myxococcota bacterium]
MIVKSILADFRLCTRHCWDNMPRVEKLSVIMPVFNERDTIEKIIGRVLEVELPMELIVVDDCSSDGSHAKLLELAGRSPEIRLVRHARNRGKGAAIRTGLEYVSGDVVVIQDADLEYDPAEYPRLLAPIREGRADVVYGSRFLGGARREFKLTHALANRFLTLLSNLVTGLDLSDMETCYKMFRAQLINCARFESERFGIEPELTAHFARAGARICEVPIGYSGRGYAAGKKIGVKDGLEAIFAILKFNLFAGRRPK